MTLTPTGPAELHIDGPHGGWSIRLSGACLILGRDPTCDVVLEDDLVSRRHARLFLDPFGRWIIEDLGSRHGVWVAGRKIDAYAILPGQTFLVRPFALQIRQDVALPVSADPSASTVLEDDAGQVADAPVSGPLSHDHLRQLNDLAADLSSVASIQDLYPRACRLLAFGPDMAVIVLRLPGAPEDKPLPEVLAFHQTGPRQAAARVDLHLSRRALRAAQTTGRAVVAGGWPSDGRMPLTLADRGRPREVLCVPIAAGPEAAEVLYVDFPADRDSRHLLDYLQAATRQVASIRNGLLLAETKAQYEGLEQQLRLARQMQSRLIFHGSRRFEGLDLAVCYQPALWVGGDYCDVWRLADGKVAFALGDVAGHGLPAAIAMANLQAALRNTLAFCRDLGRVLDHLHQHWEECLPESLLATLILGVLDPSDGALDYVNAGHMPPLLLGPSEEVLPLGQPRNPPLGAMQTHYEAFVAKLACGQGLLAVTDGITESISPLGELFGPQRLMRLLESTPATSAGQLVKAVSDAAADFRGDRPQQDDVTVLAMIRH